MTAWYLMAARTLIAWGFISFTGFISILIGLYVYAVATGRTPPPDIAQFSLLDMIMLACFIFYVMFFIVRRWWPGHWWPRQSHRQK